MSVSRNSKRSCFRRYLQWLALAETSSETLQADSGCSLCAGSGSVSITFFLVGIAASWTDKSDTLALSFVILCTVHTHAEQLKYTR